MEIGGENIVPSSHLPFAALVWGISQCLAVDLQETLLTDTTAKLRAEGAEDQWGEVFKIPPKPRRD